MHASSYLTIFLMVLLPIASAIDNRVPGAHVSHPNSHVDPATQRSRASYFQPSSEHGHYDGAASQGLTGNSLPPQHDLLRTLPPSWVKGGKVTLPLPPPQAQGHTTPQPPPAGPLRYTTPQSSLASTSVGHPSRPPRRAASQSSLASTSVGHPSGPPRRAASQLFTSWGHTSSSPTPRHAAPQSTVENVVGPPEEKEAHSRFQSYRFQNNQEAADGNPDALASKDRERIRNAKKYLKNKDKIAKKGKIKRDEARRAREKNAASN